MLVKEWMTPAPQILATASVAEARQRLEAENLAVLFVVDEQKRLKGFLTRRAATAAPSPDLSVEKILAQPQDVLTPDDPIERAAVLLAHYLVLPVVDAERHLVGVLSKDRLLQALTHLAAIGEEGLRIRLRLRDPSEIYRAMAILAEEKAALVVVLRGSEGETIIHVQGVHDPQGLRRRLEEALR